MLILPLICKGESPFSHCTICVSWFHFLRTCRKACRGQILSSVSFVPRYPSGLTGVDLFGRPVPRHEVFELGHFMVSDAREDPGQPRFGVDLVHATGFSERVGDSRSIAAAL